MARLNVEPTMALSQPVLSIEAPPPRDVTLLELVQAVCEVTSDDREVVATVLHLLDSGEVRLCGNFRGSDPKSFR